MSERTDSIFEWAMWATAKERPFYERVPRRIVDGRGLIFEPTAIHATREGTIAQVIRTKDHKEGPLVRMVLPNQITSHRWGLVFNILQREGIPVVAVPSRVLDNSDIRKSTIEVIHTERRRKFARPPHQLIRALVMPRYERKPRTTYFLSGYDRQERGLSYFFCELPPGFSGTTVEDAYQALQPESVKRALAQNRKVLRQGDMFFIQVRKEPTPEPHQVVTKGRLFDTNHKAEMVGRRNRVWFARGKVYHDPLGRRPDHKPLHLPRGWWIIVRNTVPVVRH